MILDDVADYLVAQGVATGVDVDLFKGELPPTPDNALALYEYGGEAPPLHWDGETVSIQVRVRSKVYATGRAKIQAAYEALHGLTETVLGTTRYLLVRAMQPPSSIGRDQNGRHEWTVNFQVTKER